MTVTPKVWLPVFKAIFDPSVKLGDFFNVDGANCKMELYSNGCRMVDFEDIRFMEQNKKKIHSPYAKAAREGHQIMWITSKDFSIWYGRIEDGVLKI